MPHLGENPLYALTPGDIRLFCFRTKNSGFNLIQDSPQKIWWVTAACDYFLHKTFLPVMLVTTWGNNFKHLLPTTAINACLHFKPSDLRPSFKRTVNNLRDAKECSEHKLWTTHPDSNYNVNPVPRTTILFNLSYKNLPHHCYSHF